MFKGGCESSLCRHFRSSRLPIACRLLLQENTSLENLCDTKITAIIVQALPGHLLQDFSVS